MNIMDYLLNAGLGLTENQANIMELEIREGIAQELEDLVNLHVPFKIHGIPASAEIHTDGPAGMQQDHFRGAANVVRGKDPATEADWDGQAAAMAQRRRQAIERMLFSMPAEKRQ